MSLLRKIKQKTERRATRTRRRLLEESRELPRVSIFRSLNHIYGQIIDDNINKTIASCSTLELKNLKGDKKEQSKMIGKELAKRALASGIEKVKFDRGSYLYHGRVKAIAQGLREGGLRF